MAAQTSSIVFLQYLTTVFDNITDAIMLIDIESDGYRLLTANTAFFTISGYPQDSISKKIVDIVSPESYRFLLKQYKKTIKTKLPVDYTNWSDTPLGRRAYTVRLIPIFNTVGDPVQIAGVARDMTEWMNNQTELEQLRKQLRAIKRK
ncbi:MAG TPA: PAS domain-containing protein [Patescibacteria group bacterium]|nr:PAS domain-containing protein [Patescibacteria group bacterium]